MDFYKQSSKKQLKTPQKTMMKQRSKTGIHTHSQFKAKQAKFEQNISEKYINLQLSHSAKKQYSMTKLMKDKDDRIRQLEKQIRQNQMLVKETIEKWKKSAYSEKTEVKQFNERLAQMSIKMNKIEDSNKELKTKLEQKSRDCDELEQSKGNIEQKYSELEEKYKKLRTKYESQRQQWKGTIPLIMDLLELVKKVPLDAVSQEQ